MTTFDLPVNTSRHDSLPSQSVIWGIGAMTDYLREMVKLNQPRIEVFTSKSLAPTKRARELRSVLGATVSGWHDHFKPHVPEDSLTETITQLQNSGANTIVAYGGGSVIDAAKAISDRLHQLGVLRPTLIIVPTTLAGSEYSHYYGVTEHRHDGPYKKSFVSLDATPNIVILDPQASETTPNQVWLSSGIKALDHAIEGILGSAANPVVDPVAIAGIRAMMVSLPRSESPANLDVRLQCQLAAWQCYSAPAAIRLGLSHRIGHMLGGTFGISHGLTSCITLAPVINLYTNFYPERLNKIAVAFSDEPPTTIEPGRQLRQLVVQLGLPTRLRDVGITRTQLDMLIDRVLEHADFDIKQLGASGPRLVARLLRGLW